MVGERASLQSASPMGPRDCADGASSPERGEPLFRAPAFRHFVEFLGVGVQDRIRDGDAPVLGFHKGIPEAVVLGKGQREHAGGLFRGFLHGLNGRVKQFGCGKKLARGIADGKIKTHGALPSYSIVHVSNGNEGLTIREKMPMHHPGPPFFPLTGHERQNVSSSCGYWENILFGTGRKRFSEPYRNAFRERSGFSLNAFCRGGHPSPEKGGKRGGAPFSRGPRRERVSCGGVAENAIRTVPRKGRF